MDINRTDIINGQRTIISENEIESNYFDVFKRSSNYVNADQLTDYVHRTIVFFVTPTVSIIGIVGNVLNMIVLSKQGLHKSSNILLFNLAISDILFMIGVNGPPKPMYEWGLGGYQYPKLTAHVLYYLYHIFDSLNWGSGSTSLCLPVLITVERLIAVFLPLKFKTIVTARRTAVAVIIINIIFYGLQAYVRNWFHFVYVFDPARNASVGFSIRSELYWRQRSVLKVLINVINSISFLILFVFFGCIAIGVKIKLASTKRLKMTQKSNQEQRHSSGTSKTTKTLLCLCTFYTVSCSPLCLPAIFPNFMVFPVYTENPNFRSVGVFVYHVYKLIFSVSVSFNFVIYVVTNKPFRDTFLSLV